MCRTLDNDHKTGDTPRNSNKSVSKEPKYNLTDVI